MKMAKWVVLILSCAALSATAQFKEQVESKPNVGESLIRPPGNNFLFGWFDPSRLTMHHSYSLSYMTSGGQGLSLGMYTNSLFYKIADPLDVQFDVSLVHSPYSSFGPTNDLSGIFLSRAQLNYRPSENMLLQIQYRQLPPMYWMGGTPWGGFGGFSRYDEEAR